MNLSRRSLLTGLLSSAAVIAAGPVASVVPTVVYANRSFRTQEDICFLEGISQQIVTTFWYGVPACPPAVFSEVNDRLLRVSWDSEL